MWQTSHRLRLRHGHVHCIRQLTQTRLTSGQTQLVRQLATITPPPVPPKLQPKIVQPTPPQTPTNKPPPPPTTVPTATASTSSSISTNSTNNEKNTTSSSTPPSSTSSWSPSPAYRQLRVPVDLTAAMNRLPLFRATAPPERWRPHPTSAFSEQIDSVVQQTTRDITTPDELSPTMNGWLRRILVNVLTASTCLYVKVTPSTRTNRLDFEDGAEDALLAMSEKFNTFHLEESRTALRAITQPNVFKALERTWQLFDAQGFRLQWKVEILDSFVRQAYLNDPHGRSGGFMMRLSPVLNTKGGLLKPTHQSEYLDMDVQYQVQNSFEIWTTRPFDQTDPQPTQTNESKDAPTESPVNSLNGARSGTVHAPTTNTPSITSAAPRSTTPSAPPPPLNFLPPLKCIATLRQDAKLGLRFWTALPSSHHAFVCYPPVFPFTIGLFRAYYRFVRNRGFRELTTPPTPNWFIKEILDGDPSNEGEKKEEGKTNK